MSEEEKYIGLGEILKRPPGGSSHGTPPADSPFKVDPSLTPFEPVDRVDSIVGEASKGVTDILSARRDSNAMISRSVKAGKIPPDDMVDLFNSLASRISAMEDAMMSFLLASKKTAQAYEAERIQIEAAKSEREAILEDVKTLRGTVAALRERAVELDRRIGDRMKDMNSIHAASRVLSDLEMTFSSAIGGFRSSGAPQADPTSAEPAKLAEPAERGPAPD